MMRRVDHATFLVFVGFAGLRIDRLAWAGVVAADLGQF